jgi:hypothetical protein
MFGSALALGLAYNSEALGRLAGRMSTQTAGRLGWVAGCGLLTMFFTLHWVSQASFRGLMVLAALLRTVILYLLVACPALGALLEHQPLQWLGRRSYGIFLWHWPLLIIVSAIFGTRYNQAPWWLILTVLALSVGLTLATEHLVNNPVAALGFRGYFHRIGALPRAARVGVAALAATGLVATGAAAATAPQYSLITMQIMAGAEQAALTQGSGDNIERPYIPKVIPSPPDAAALTLGPLGSTDPSGLVGLTNIVATVDANTLDDSVNRQVSVPRLPPTGDQVTAIGDSVLLGSAPQLIERLPGVYIDGAVSRQFFHAEPIAAELDLAGELRPYVLVALATNGTIKGEWIDSLVAAIGPDRTLLLVTGYGDRDWIGEANAQLHDAAERFHGQVVLVDWNAAVEAQEGLLGGDGIHPNQDGMARYADLIIDVLATFAD